MAIEGLPALKAAVAERLGAGGDDSRGLWLAVQEAGGTFRMWIDHSRKKIAAECRLGPGIAEPRLAYDPDPEVAAWAAVALALGIKVKVEVK